MAAMVAQAAVARAAAVSQQRKELGKNKVEAFDKFDGDGSNSLDKNEVRQAIKFLWPNKKLTAKEITRTMAKYGQEQADGELTIDIAGFGQLTEDLNKLDKKKKEGRIRSDDSCLGDNKKLPGQDAAFAFYNNGWVVAFVACCIMCNFLVNILEKEIDPDMNNLQFESVWYWFDFIFNIIFIIELLLNMYTYGGPVREFWADGWNVFDTIIVTVGFLTMVNALGPPLDKLKLLRAFRVFRIFKRVESLNKIIVALMASVPGVINAFVVMFIFFCIYAILAVELFRDFGIGGNYTTYDDDGIEYVISAETARGYLIGIEYYGTFMRALYTLFQVMTGESWSEAVARPLLFGMYGGNATLTGFYFVSFIILMQMVLINVVVAVLLDKFVIKDEEEEDDKPSPEAAVAEVPAAVAAETFASQVSPKLENMPTPSALPAPGNTDRKLDLILQQLQRIDQLAEKVTACQADVAALRKEMKESRSAADNKKMLQAV